ncbi:MAG: ABC transporter [Actinomyces sp.]|uniref:ABC transporter permease n=1 Tax=Actinomyces sp. TaxID=29317 RepID=UPI0026DC359D|nr:ABC transporter [Actinomyces sp.]MDO4242314.1 ABC transporter [Actinomyces sp.]
MSPVRPSSGQRPLAGTARMVLLGTRTAKAALLSAALLPAGLVLGVARSIEALYPTVEERQRYAQWAEASPGTIAFNGQGYGLTTLGGITAYEIGFMGQILFPTLGAVLAVRLTRREEESGRTELLTAGVVGRLAPLAAAVILLAVGVVCGTVLMVAGMVGLGLPGSAAVWYAAGAAACTLFFAAAGLLLSQLCQSARTASLLGLSLTALAFLARAAGDVRGSRAALVSPLGWLPEVRAFAVPQGWPLLAYGVGAVVLLAGAGAVTQRRDLGAGVLAPRRGREQARRTLVTSGGLAWRVCAHGILGWLVLASAWALVMGLLGQEMKGMAEANPGVLAALGVERGTDLLVMLATIVMGASAVAVGIHAGTRLAAEEESGRLGAVLSTRVPRARTWLAWWAVAVLGSQAVLGVSSLLLGLSTWAVTGDRQDLGTAVEVGAGYAVPVLFAVGLCAALASAGPRWAPTGWALLAWILIVGFLAEALRLPEWSRDLSPLHLVGVLPAEELDVGAVAALAAGAMALLAASARVFSGRDLASG